LTLSNFSKIFEACFAFIKVLIEMSDLMKPVNAGAVGDCRKFPSPDPEGAADRGEAEDDLELFADSIDEELPAVLLRVLKSGTLHFVPHHGHDVFDLFGV
jgi:hypothetical protein